MFEVNNKDSRTTPGFIVNLEHISHLALLFLLLTLNILSAGTTYEIQHKHCVKVFKIENRKFLLFCIFPVHIWTEY